MALESYVWDCFLNSKVKILVSKFANWGLFWNIFQPSYWVYQISRRVLAFWKVRFPQPFYESTRSLGLFWPSYKQVSLTFLWVHNVTRGASRSSYETGVVQMSFVSCNLWITTSCFSQSPNEEVYISHQMWRFVSVATG